MSRDLPVRTSNYLSGSPSRYNLQPLQFWIASAIHLFSKVGMSPKLLFHFQSRLTIVLAITLVFACAVGAAAFDKRVAIVSADFSERAGLFFVAKDQRFFEEQG